MIGRLVLLLLAANLGWFAWSQGWLRALGLAPQSVAEPQRLERQLRPDAMTLRPLGSASASAVPAPPAAADAGVPAPAAQGAAPADSASAPSSADAGGTCLQAGVFDDRQVATVRKAAASLPAGSWRIDEVQLPGRWMVYIGKLADAGAVASKRAELRELGIDTDRPGAALEPGLSLGRFSTEDAAQRGLDNLARKGVRTARVVQERRDAPGHVLRLPQASDSLRQQAAGALRGALAGRELQRCD